MLCHVFTGSVWNSSCESQAPPTPPSKMSDWVRPPAVREIITTFAPERGELVVDEAILDLAGTSVDAPAAAAPRPPRRRSRWSRHGKGGTAGGGATGGTAGGGTAAE